MVSRQVWIMQATAVYSNLHPLRCKCLRILLLLHLQIKISNHSTIARTTRIKLRHNVFKTYKGTSYNSTIETEMAEFRHLTQWVSIQPRLRLRAMIRLRIQEPWRSESWRRAWPVQLCLRPPRTMNVAEARLKTQSQWLLNGTPSNSCFNIRPTK